MSKQDIPAITIYEILQILNGLAEEYLRSPQLQAQIIGKAIKSVNDDTLPGVLRMIGEAHKSTINQVVNEEGESLLMLALQYPPATNFSRKYPDAFDEFSDLHESANSLVKDLRIYVQFSIINKLIENGADVNYWFKSNEFSYISKNEKISALDIALLFGVIIPKIVIQLIINGADCPIEKFPQARLKMYPLATKKISEGLKEYLKLGEEVNKIVKEIQIFPTDLSGLILDYYHRDNYEQIQLLCTGLESMLKEWGETSKEVCFDKSI